MISISLFRTDDENRALFLPYSFKCGTEDGYEEGIGLILWFFGVAISKVKED